MTDVEAVALWVGLISSIVGVVLSVVAIAFAVLVNNRASDINDKMMQSLQKVEFSVERSSDDTRELIKAGWDKLLSNVGRSPETRADNLPIKEIASGLSAELRAELGMNESSDNQTQPIENEQIERMNDLLESLETSLEIQLDLLNRLESPSEALDYVLSKLADLSPEAQELARAIIPRHLTWAQYQSLLTDSRVSEAVNELRMKGLLVPLEGYSEEEEVIPVYYFPSTLSELIRTALLLLPDMPSTVSEAIEAGLQRVGYLKQE